MTPKLIDAANDVSAFASTDDTRFTIKSIHFTDAGTEATNGRICIRVPYPAIDVKDFPPVAGVGDEMLDCIVPPGAVKEALAKVPKRMSLPVLQTVRVSAVNSGVNKAQFAVTDLDVERVTTARLIDGQYPSLQKVWPTEEPKLSIALSAHLLKAVCEYAIKHGKESGDCSPFINLRFIDHLSPVRFDFPLADGRRADGVVMPSRMQ